jgi:hypothetical protein
MKKLYIIKNHGAAKRNTVNNTWLSRFGKNHGCSQRHLEQLLEVRDQITPWAKINILKPYGEQRTPMEEEHWKVQMELRCKLKEYSMFDTT